MPPLAAVTVTVPLSAGGGATRRVVVSVAVWGGDSPSLTVTEKVLEPAAAGNPDTPPVEEPRLSPLGSAPALIV